MMSLLLCFFILLAAFSEMKKDEEYQRVVEGIKEAFGYSGGVGVLPSNDVPLRSMIEMLESAVMKEMKQTKVSNTTDEGPQGKETKVTKVHEGMMFTIGGNLTFEPGSRRAQARGQPRDRQGLQTARRSPEQNRGPRACGTKASSARLALQGPDRSVVRTSEGGVRGDGE